MYLIFKGDFMKIKKLLLLLLFSCGFSLFAQNHLSTIPEVIRYEIKNDFKKFQKYVNKGKDLSVKTEKGLSVVMATAYFSTENFEKACELLYSNNVDLDQYDSENKSLLHLLCASGSYDKIKILLKYNPQIDRVCSTGQTPAQMTQYITHKYYENQLISPEKWETAEKIRELLLGDKVAEFEYSELTHKNYGNLVTLIYLVLRSIWSPISFSIVNDFNLVTINSENGQNMGTVSTKSLNTLLRFVIINSEAYKDIFFEIKEFTSTPDIINAIYDSVNSPYIYLVKTGNSPICADNWGCINGILDNTLSKDTFLLIEGAEPSYNQYEYQLKDISYLIAIKLPQKK